MDRRKLQLCAWIAALCACGAGCTDPAAADRAPASSWSLAVRAMDSTEAPAAVRAAEPALAGTRMAAADVAAITVRHNRTRAAVGVGPLRWSDAIAGYAQQWADHLAASGCGLQHRNPDAYGENLFEGTASAFHAEDAAVAWASEKSSYHGGVLTGSNWHGSGHYTQMVWRATTTFGCGEALCGDTRIVACNYDPPGNVIGQAPY